MGKKRIKGEGAIHDEQKSQVGGIWLTPTAKDALTGAAAALGISRSELIERLARKGVEWLVGEGAALRHSDPEPGSELMPKRPESKELVSYRFSVRCDEIEVIFELDATLTEEEIEEEFIAWRSGYVDSYWEKVEE